MPVPGMNRQSLMDQIPRGSLPNDEYGTGHQQVDPRYSRQTNMNAAQQSLGDANYAGIQELYGSPNVPPAPMTEGIYPQDKGLGPAASMEFGMRGSRLNDSLRKMTELFGEESAAQILDEVLRVSAFQDIGGQVQGRQAPDRMMGEGMPRPDFGNQQPYTTGPTGDGDMMALEQYYGYPVSGNNLTGNPNAPVRNMPQQQNGPRRLPKGRERLSK
jgi:hypothetical protein